MSRNTLLLILTILFSMAVFWYFKSSQLESSEITQKAMPVRFSEVVESGASRIPQVAPLERTPPLSDSKENQRVEREREIAHLQSQLAEESQKLEEQSKMLEQLRQSRQNAPVAASYRSSISSRDLEIQYLTETLGTYRQAEQDMNRSAALALRNQDHGAQVARDQLERDIQNLELGILNTQNELNYWLNYSSGVDFIRQRSEIERLQNQLAQQQNELTPLRAQRVDISAQVLNNSQSIEALTERAKEEIRNSAAETQGQILSLRSEINRLQEMQSQNQSQLSALDSQLRKTEKDYEERSNKVRSLEETLRAKQAELH
ncbi:MAG TPA: hypothetical protein VIG33_17575 [Pseudobdellovibrionaceae bacterium]|jgi:chromosome segregation ATPase